MYNVLDELNEKLKELCLSLDLDPYEYGVVTKRGLEQLCRDAEILSALEEYGVDNWEGYGDAMQSLKEEINA